MRAGSTSTQVNPSAKARAAVSVWPARSPSAAAAPLTACNTRRCAGPANSTSGASASSRPRRTVSSASCGSRMQAQSMAHQPRPAVLMGAAGTRPPRHLSTRHCAGGRQANASASPVSAATCKRRKARSSTRSGQHSTAAQLPERRHCSAAQSASSGLASTCASQRRSTPAACQAGA